MLKKAVYAELRDIVDTRLSTIAILDKELAIQAVQDDNYINRIYDEYKYLTHDLFKYYQQQNLEQQLTEAFASKLIELISVELDLLLSKTVQANETSIVDLDINTYPYKLTDEVKNRLAQALIISLISDDVQINFIYKEPTELTLSYVDSKYTTMFMYNGADWLEYHIALLDGQAVDTKLYIPGLLPTPIKVTKEKDLEAIFQSYNELYKPYISVTTIPVDFFHIRTLYLKAFIDKYTAK